MSHEEILKMIEEVGPADTDKLDEIDARVWVFTERPGHMYGGIWQDGSATHFGGKIRRSIFSVTKTDEGHNKNHDGAEYWPKYTRSRDALKAIRPDNYYPDFYTGPKGAIVNLCIPFNCEKYGKHAGTCFDSGLMPTEELAEIHAIIQAIDYERQTSRRER